METKKIRKDLTKIDEIITEFLKVYNESINNFSPLNDNGEFSKSMAGALDNIVNSFTELLAITRAEAAAYIWAQACNIVDMGFNPEKYVKGNFDKMLKNMNDTLNPLIEIKGDQENGNTKKDR